MLATQVNENKLMTYVWYVYKSENFLEQIRILSQRHDILQSFFISNLYLMRILVEFIQNNFHQICKVLFVKKNYL